MDDTQEQIERLINYEKHSQINSIIRSNSEYLPNMKYQQFKNIEADQTNFNVSFQHFHQVIIQTVYLLYAASKKSMSVYINPQSDFVFKRQCRNTSIYIYYELNSDYDEMDVVVNMKKIILELNNIVLKKNSDNKITFNKQLPDIQKSLQQVIGKPIRDAFKHIQQLPIFDLFSKLKRIQNSLQSLFFYNQRKAQIQGVKKQKIKIRPDLQLQQAVQVAKNISQIFQKHYIKTSRIQQDPINSSYTIRMFLFYARQKVQTWDNCKGRFLVQISPRQRVICIRLLVNRDDKFDYVDQNMYKTNMFSFKGNLVSCQIFKLTLKQQKVSDSSKRSYFAFKTSTDIGVESDNCFKMIMVMDYLLASYKAIESYFSKPVNDTINKMPEMIEQLQHYQQIVMRSLVNIYKDKVQNA